MEKTIVFLHGFGEDHSIFHHQTKLLESSYNIFAPDLPGSGIRANHVWEKGTETIDWMADWLFEQLEAKNIRDCVLFGHSMGGYITMAFAEKYPEKLAALGLIHSTAFADREAKKETRAKAITFMQEKGGFTFLKTAIPGLFGQGFLNQNPEAVEDLVEKSRGFQPESLVAYYRAMIARPDRTEVLKKFAKPVLLIAGTDDTAIPLEDVLLQSSMPAICHFHILENTGHMGMVESPENLNEHLLNFMTAL